MHIHSYTRIKNGLYRSVTLILGCMVCFCYYSFSQQFVRKGNTVTYRGNKFEYAKGVTEKVAVPDPVTRKVVTKKVTRDAIPAKMNGIRIYRADEVTEKPTQVDESVSLPLFVLKGLTSEFNKLPDGRYLVYLSNIIIDDKGKLVYYEYEGISPERGKMKIADSVKTAIDIKIDPLMNKLAFKPGKVKSKPVIVRTDIDMGIFVVVVKNHKAIATRSY